VALDESRFFPAQNASEADLLRFRDRIINRWSTYRNQHMGRIALSFWYYLGRQWAELDAEAAFDGVRGSILRDVDTSDLPRPVTNEISPAMEEEMIALVGRKWIATNTPTSNDPRIKAAAQVAKDQLNYRLEQLQWQRKRRQTALHFAVGGTGLIYSTWDKSYFNLRTVGAPSAVYCGSCSLKLYSPDIPLATFTAGLEGRPFSHAEAARELPLGEGEGVEDKDDARMMRLSYCPRCQEAHELKRYDVPEEEARESDDILGRPLGIQEPRGGTEIEIDIPFEFYPQNAGARVSPYDLKRWGRRKIRSLEWIEERFPHLVHLISPDPPSELLYDDPMLGEWSVLGSWSPSLDSGILDNHALVDEIVDEPSFRHPRGRYVVATKDLVLEDSPLLEEQYDETEGEKLYVPRVQMSISRYKIRPLELWGTSGPDEVISPQNRENGIDAQLIEARLRMGGPNMFMHPDMWVDNPIRTDSSYGLGKIFFFNPSLANPQFAKPEVFGGELMSDSVYMERDRVQADIKRIIGPSDASRGVAPKNVGTTSGLQLLIEGDERSRSLREEEFVSSVERTWSHILQLEWILRVDPDVYRVLGPDKTWKYEQYRGAMLRGQYEIKIERSAFIGKSVVRREAMREAIADGLVAVDTPVARRRALEAYGTECDVSVNADQQYQVDQADRQWVDFSDKGLVRVQDSIDDPGIRYLVLGTHLLSDEGQRITLENSWDDKARAIAGWEAELQRASALEQSVIAFYGGRLGAEEAKVAYATAMVAYDEQMQLHEKQLETTREVAATPIPGAPPPPEPPAPSKPPPPIFLPALLQDRILTIWQGMFEKAGIELSGGVTEGMERDPLIYVKFRALVEAYRMSGAGGPAAMPAPNGPPAAPPAATAPANTGKGGNTPPPTAPMPEGGKH
jgi:hypothetical protein